MSLSLEILSPTKILAREMSVDEIIIPARWGQTGILPGHADYVTVLASGTIEYRVGVAKKSISITGGILCVENQRVTATVET